MLASRGLSIRFVRGYNPAIQYTRRAALEGRDPRGPSSLPRPVTFQEILARTTGRVTVFDGDDAVRIAVWGVETVAQLGRPLPRGCDLEALLERARRCVRVTLTRSADGKGHDWTYRYREPGDVLLAGGDDY